MSLPSSESAGFPNKIAFLTSTSCLLTYWRVVCEWHKPGLGHNKPFLLPRERNTIEVNQTVNVVPIHLTLALTGLLHQMEKHVANCKTPILKMTLTPQ